MSNQTYTIGDNQPTLASSEDNIFTGAQNVVVTDAQFNKIYGNYDLHHSVVSPDMLPPLPPPRHSSAMFTGRGIYLERLKDYFGSIATKQRKSFLLLGMGGIGKTQICLKFVEESETLFSDIFWIDASSASTIDLTLRKIAQANSGIAEAASPAASVLMWISKKFNWLMIYDNADGGYQIVEKFLPPGNGGNILITSRNLELKRITEKSMEVLEMGEEEALSLLSKSARLNYTSENIQAVAKQLISKLGGIPLAIDQAGAYMLTCKCPLDDYMELYAKNHDQLMSNPLFKGASDYGSCTYGTWEISMKEIEGRAAQKKDPKAMAAESAITLHQIFAFLHHENIPAELFKNAAENYKKRNIDEEKEHGLPLSITILNPKVLFLDEMGEWNKMKFHLGIQVLLSFSLIKSSGTHYSVHPLVHSWSRNRIPKMEITQQVLMTKAFVACSVELDYKIDNYEYCGLLTPHIRTINNQAAQLNLNNFYYDDECGRFSLVYDHIGSWNELEKLTMWMLERRKANLAPKHPFVLDSMANLASTYRKQGSWDEAEKLEVEVMEARKEKLGSHHPDTLNSMANLSSTYRIQGRWDVAEKLDVEVMEARKEKLGSQHPDTLTSMGNLASTYSYQGKWDEAEKLGVEVMKARKEKLGSQHPDTLITVANLASTYRCQGRWDEAEKLDIEVMEARKEKLGSQHPDTLTSMGNLASTYRNQGRWDEAEKLQVEVMEASKEKLGSHHPDTLTSMANLASTYSYQGRWDEAEKLQVEVMEARKEKLGSHHPDTLTSMANLASTYRKQGRWDEAEKLQVEVMEASKEKLRSQHPDTLITVANLASTYRCQGRWDEAEKLDIEVMEAKKEKLGSQHPDTLTSMGNLASTYRNQGRWDEAEKLEVEVMEARKEKLGSQHPDTLTSMGNLASTYRNQGRWDEAEKLEVEVMEASKEKLGSHHPDTLTSMANLASTYSYQGRWDEAEKLEVEVMEARKEKLGSHHPDTLTSMANLASTYRKQGRWDKAEKLQVEVMKARQDKLGSHHPDTLTSVANLASTYKCQGRWDKANRLEVEVMEARKEKLGSQHPDTLTSMANLASTYWIQGRWDVAEKLDIEVVKASKEKLGSHHPNTLTSMANLASTYRNQGKWDEAEKLEVEVMEACKERLGSHHPDTLNSMANLASTYRIQGRWDEAEKLEVEVMEARKEKLGSHHPDTLTSIANLTSTYRKQEKWDEAEKLEVEVMEARKEKLGSHHPDTLTSMASLSRTYREQERWYEAEKLEVLVMEARKEKLGPQHPDTLASTYRKQERCSDYNQLAISSADIGADVCQFIRMNIKEIKVRNPKLALEILDTLTSGAQRSFPWLLSHQLLQLQKLRAEEQIRNFVNCISSKMDHLLFQLQAEQSMYADYSWEKFKYILPIVQWAVRPMTIPELEDAVAMAEMQDWQLDFDIAGIGKFTDVGSHFQVVCIQRDKQNQPNFLMPASVHSTFTNIPLGNHFGLMALGDLTRCEHHPSSTSTRQVVNAALARLCLMYLKCKLAHYPREVLSHASDHPFTKYAVIGCLDHIRASETDTLAADFCHFFASGSATLEGWCYLYKKQLGKFGASGIGEHVVHLDCVHLAVWFNLPMMLHQFSKSELMAENYRGLNTLHAAVGRIPSCLAVMDCLLGKIDVNSLSRQGDTALHIAISKSAKAPTIIQRLVKAGANVNARDRAGRTPLHLILMLTEPEHALSSISALLQSGEVDINARDAFSRTPLHLASAAPAYIFKRRFTGPECQGSSAEEHKQILRILLERGADIESRDDANETPLHIAAKNANAFAVKLLLQRGASIIARNDHYDTPIHLAIAHMTPDSSLIRFPLQESDDHACTIKCLLANHDSNVNATNQSDRTPLHIAACFRCDLTIFSALVQHGAIVDATDNENATPLHLAVKMGPVLNANDVEGQWRISWVAFRQIIQFSIKNSEDSQMLREVADKVCETLRSHYPNIVTRYSPGMDYELVEPTRPDHLHTTWVKEVSNLLRPQGASINLAETSKVYGTLRFAMESWASWISNYHWMLAESQDKDDDTSLAAAYVAWSEIAKLLS
ncbi:hypothetical protein F5887DRAFT_1285897 [Amanita rubescens]|nr:hypothetical protein F5887DRAFT_1285897 [Amanita rubescens]